MTALEFTTVEMVDCVGECRSCPSVGSCGDRLVCRCLKITEHSIVTSIRGIGLTTIDEVKAAGTRLRSDSLHELLWQTVQQFPDMRVVFNVREEYMANALTELEKNGLVRVKPIEAPYSKQVHVLEVRAPRASI